MLCPAAARQPCKDERRRHADRQHPAKRRELVEKPWVRILAVLGQCPERVDELHAAERPQHRQRMACAERCKQREHQIKQCKHRQSPADRIELRTNVARREKLLGQRQMCEKVNCQCPAPPAAIHCQRQTEQQAGIVGRQQPRGAAAVKLRRAGLRQRSALRCRIGPRQEQAERRQHNEEVHPNAACPQPMLRSGAAVPALLPYVERPHGPRRQHPQKIGRCRAVTVDRRRGAA